MIALLGAGFGTVVLTIIFILVCILLIFMVTITPSQEGGMAAAFGGMGSDTFFGTKAHQHINKFMVFLAVAFLLLAVLLNKINAGGSGGKTGIEEKLKDLPPPPPKPGAPTGNP